MESEIGEIEPKFWRIFKRVMQMELASDHYTASALSQWDSLKHVELMFELEEGFNIEIEPQKIVELYSSTDEILNFLNEFRIDEKYA
jgi:acyl carrier protein